ncbi:DoxX family protein [Microbacterium sp. Sa4CUA7]|uniref:DoxX family protein n=1 Tax=Microbacterium pullorum TaxID=2762236 RepID=A0ABR8S2Q4_9MICO|nr:DoxX family protein [Microbacterium pullorum]
MRSLSSDARLQTDLRPARFIAECFDDVGFPKRYWWIMSPIKFAAALGLILGIWIPALGLVTVSCLILYFLVAIALHIRARDLGRNLFVNAAGMLALCLATLIVCFLGKWRRRGRPCRMRCRWAPSDTTCTRSPSWRRSSLQPKATRIRTTCAKTRDSGLSGHHATTKDSRRITPSAATESRLSTCADTSVPGGSAWRPSRVDPPRITATSGLMPAVTAPRWMS